MADGADDRLLWGDVVNRRRLAIWGDGSERGTRIYDLETGSPVEGMFNMFGRFPTGMGAMGFVRPTNGLSIASAYGGYLFSQGEWTEADLVEVRLESMERQLLWLRGLTVGGPSVG